MQFPRPQLHLTTCIVLMLVAGGLLWANLSQRDVLYMASNGLYPKVEYGWPIRICADGYFINHEVPDPSLSRAVFTGRAWYYENLAIDLTVALAILTATAFLCECLLRRRRQI